MAGYFDPLLVTGLQADYKLNDNWTAVGGFNRGWHGVRGSRRDTLNFLGGVKWASDDKRSNLSVMVDAGPQSGFTGLHDRTSVITVYTHKFTERFAVRLAVYRGHRGATAPSISPGQDASWYGTEQLFTYKLNDKWSAGLRYEWVRDNDGSRVAGIGNVLLTDRGWNGLPGLAGAYNDLSLGLNWRPHPNFVLRPEVRWDWYDGRPNQPRPASLRQSYQATTVPRRHGSDRDVLIAWPGQRTPNAAVRRIRTGGRVFLSPVDGTAKYANRAKGRASVPQRRDKPPRAEALSPDEPDIRGRQSIRRPCQGNDTGASGVPFKGRLSAHPRKRVT